MRAMDSMLSYGDHSVVIGGIYENVHSMEVRVMCVCLVYVPVCFMHIIISVHTVGDILELSCGYVCCCSAVC